MRKLLLFSLPAVLLISAGCNSFESISDSESPEACKYEVTKALDKQDYDKAIALLNGICKTAFSDEKRNINLGAAYLGKAGYDIPSLLSDLLDSTDSDDPMATFLSKVAGENPGDDLKDLEEARKYYSNALGNIDCNSTSLDYFEKDVCFFKGIADFAKAATSFSLLFQSVGVEENVQQVIEIWAGGNDTESLTCDLDANQNNVPDSVEFSAGALEYAATGNVTSCDSVVPEGNFTFGYPNKKFEVIKLTINANGTCSDNATDYKVLEILSSDTKTVVLTDGYCDADNGTTCDALNETARCYPCPIVTENDTETVISSIVELINNGTETMASVISDDNEDVEESLTDIKRDICEPNPSACLCSFDGVTWNDCTNDTLDSATDVKIKSDNETLVQDLLADYLTK
ncbi:hypothetical protein [Desulfurobacterium atlanticum]|uniref:Uncharacterized protein n=1 Tax=Desulfurobacterium atlanticum TaxID=240169 RepID=A0A238Y0P2_9BACT|nr:hypothetical protein [Desulfurobacterium atlanticum]SNR64876.1 hypothetical protein SAMN06265340_10229 [Desulfurobacterium atlanticum]